MQSTAPLRCNSLRRWATTPCLSPALYLCFTAYLCFTLCLFCNVAAGAVPLQPLSDGHLAVPTTVNGQGPFPFILDTGADGSGVYQWFAKKHHLKIGKSESLVGMTGSITVPTYGIARLTVDGRLVTHITADSYPDRHDSGQQAGIVGNEFMDGTITVFDFPCKTVSVMAKPVDVKSLVGRADPVRTGQVQNGSELTLPITVNGIHGVAVLDTGSRDTKINQRFADALQIDKNSATFHDSDIIYGANSKPMASRKGPIGTVRFAGVTVDDGQAKVIDLIVFETFGIADQPAMQMGFDLMQSYRLVYDHDQKDVWFAASRCTTRQ